MSDQKREIDDLRMEIARVDAQLLSALEKRAKASRAIGELRKGQPAALSLNERANLEVLVARAGEHMPVESLREIFRTIYASSLALELPAKVAYVGPEGGATHATARAHFGASATLVASEDASVALEEVARHRADFALARYETSSEGSVQATIDALTASDLKIVAVIEATPSLHLLSRTGNPADMERIYATAADRAICDQFLSRSATRATGGGRVSAIDVKSPLVACQLAVEDHGGAAIASELVGAQLGLSIAHKNILDRGSERVRYAIIGARPSSRSGEDATSLVFSVSDSPGALLDVLRQFAERGINLSKIQSRPVDAHGWSYLFFLEVVGHVTDRQLVTAFEEVKRLTKFFKVLGSYPAHG